jgi:hypothetical protein
MPGYIRVFGHHIHFPQLALLPRSRLSPRRRAHPISAARPIRPRLSGSPTIGGTSKPLGVGRDHVGHWRSGVVSRIRSLGLVRARIASRHQTQEDGKQQYILNSHFIISFLLFRSSNPNSLKRRLCHYLVVSNSLEHNDGNVKGS